VFASLRRAAARLSASRKAEPTFRIHDAPDVAAREPGGVAIEQAARLERALENLPVEQREIITLKVDGGLTFAEIASVLGISANTAASRYRYALEKLRTALEGCR
jgi:RNA polymerase sigma-70 factor (ECF subfamily)